MKGANLKHLLCQYKLAKLGKPSLPCSIFLVERCAGGGAGGSSDLPAEVALMKIYHHIMEEGHLGRRGRVGSGQVLSIELGEKNGKIIFTFVRKDPNNLQTFCSKIHQG